MAEGALMIRRHEVLNADEWHRACRGRHRAVPGLAALNVPEVLESLPWQYCPYVLVAHDLVPGEKGYVSRSWAVDAATIGDLIGDGVWQYFILSERLSPALVGKLPSADGRTLSTNGAISLQIGLTARSGPQSPSLGLVSRVAANDGRFIEHREYLAIFEAAVRSARALARESVSKET